MKRAVALIACAAGCSAYRAGQLFRTPDGTAVPNHISAECIDLVVTPLAGSLPETPRAVLLQFDFGNPCEREVATDFGAIEVIVLTDAGDARAAPFDPRLEIRPATLDPRSTASERILYPLPGDSGLLQGVCVAVDHAFRNVARKTPLCFRLEHDVWLLEPDR